MIKDKKILALILARGGSKGISGKNIKLLNGKPLIAYTIDEAKKSRYLDKIVLSTDDENIALIGNQFGAKVPFLRPKELATDNATSEDAMYHAINWLQEKENFFADFVMLLQPTSPLRIVEDIDKAVELIVEEKGDSLIGLVESEKHPYWMMRIVDNEAVPYKDSIEYTRRQELPTVYNINGAIYITKTSIFLKSKSRWAGKTIPYIMPSERSLDIDNMMDWRLAELLIKEREQ